MDLVWRLVLSRSLACRLDLGLVGSGNLGGDAGGLSGDGCAGNGFVVAGHGLLAGLVGSGRSGGTLRGGGSYGRTEGEGRLSRYLTRNRLLRSDRRRDPGRLAGLWSVGRGRRRRRLVGLTERSRRADDWGRWRRLVGLRGGSMRDLRSRGGSLVYLRRLGGLAHGRPIGMADRSRWLVALLIDLTCRRLSGRGSLVRLLNWCLRWSRRLAGYWWPVGHAD